MTTKYYAILTNTGAALLANATALGRQLQITQMALGDGGGTLPTPDPAQTKLVNECRRAPLNSLSVDPANPGQIIAEQVIPEDEGGWWIREIGLYDAAGNLIAVANCPETYKPKLQEGSGRVQTVRMILIVSSTDAVTLKIDPSVVLATRSYVDGKFSNAVLTGTPTAPTAAVGTGTTQIATTAFVQAAVSKRVDEVTGNAPGALNTLEKLAESLGNDPNFSNTVSHKLNITEIVGIPLPWPQAIAPTGWLKCNGQAFDKTLYPKLAALYPSGTLPDLRGEFIRGWDDGRGVDSGRGLLSAQRATLLRTAMIDYAGTDLDNSRVLNGLAYAEADGSTTSIYPASAIYAPNGDNLSNNAAADNAVSGTSSFAAFQTGVTPPNWISVRPRNIAFNYIVRAA
ncbi:phage tail protein [Dickeya oryzae]|uniref:phage tail-collar fiber domain-containing protein n=1 Tax=Dickeya oryzae TaxID=1240404 RepID=UPI001AECC85C|nr:phage tail protein [Dickeya oryzae]MBP2846334.1 phage tail protein [Dickeya oryzae]